jgi:glycosyltransferase involved in cell wall biosynthesis
VVGRPRVRSRRLAQLSLIVGAKKDLRILISTSSYSIRFWHKLIEYLPSGSEGKAILVWNEGSPSFSGALTPRRLYKEVRDMRPDVLITDMPVGQGFHLEFLRAVGKTRARYVIYLRGDIWTELEFQVSEKRSRLSSSFSAHRFLSYTRTWLAERSLGTQLTRADVLLVICKWLQERVHEELHGKMEARVLYQGVDPSMFYPDEKIALRHPNVGIVQTYNIFPKAQALADFRNVIERMQDVHFYIVKGAPSDEVGGAQHFGMVLKALCDLPNVHWVQPLEYPSGVRRFLSSCDVYALVSGLDCCPTTLLEASLVETPILASKVGGIPELVVQGETGFCIDNDASNEWIEKIRLLQEDQYLARKLGTAARVYVASRFSWQVIARDLVLHLEETMTH